MIAVRFLSRPASSAISAMMPPSPSLSTRMATETYLIEVIMINVQKMSERLPRATALSSTCAPFTLSTVFSV